MQNNSIARLIVKVLMPALLSIGILIDRGSVANHLLGFSLHTCIYILVTFIILMLSIIIELQPVKLSANQYNTLQKIHIFFFLLNLIMYLCLDYKLQVVLLKVSFIDYLLKNSFYLAISFGAEWLLNFLKKMYN